MARTRLIPAGRQIAIAALVVTAVASSVTAVRGFAPQPAAPPSVSRAAALSPADREIERKVDALLKRMTVPEKLQQTQLLSDGQITDADAKAGVGGVFSLVDPVKIRHFQEVAVQQSRLHIPILFAYDTIHGYRTTFPIPLGTAASFDPAQAQADARFGARESAAVGIKQVYSPMVDVSHEPRWGRISEGGGEDPYLNGVLGAARVKGAQGGDYSASEKVVTSVKHFVAYGQPEGGRDYNTTDMSEQRLRNVYLPPFKAAIDAGADSVMCSFNSISGVPGCANPHTETQILKGEWGFDGFVESDYTAVDELLNHGVAGTGADAAALALNAGTDSEMVGTNLRDNGAALLASGKISINRLDDAVRRILRVKFRAGLFDHPYADPSKADAAQLRPDAVAAARTAAGKSMVLLKNDGGVLPMNPAKKTAVIGPLGDDQHDMLGPWWGQGKDTDAVTVFDGVKAVSPNATFTPACGVKNVEPPEATDDDVCGTTEGFAAAVAAAKAADQVVLAVGENREMSGEAAARSTLDLPGRQQQLIDAIKATGKPFAVVLFNGRPLTLGGVAASSPAVLEAWFPGVQAGNAVADVVFGKVNPGGKLPVTFPRALGQVPVYYNHEPTGRPCDATQKYTSRYRDIPSCAPLYEFGYGLSYTTFATTNLKVDKTTVGRDGRVRATVDVANTGKVAGDEVVQLYVHDPVASISQPVRRLRDFQRVTLKPGEKRTVAFTLDREDLGFYDAQGKFVVEPGRFDLYAGDSSAATLTTSITVR